MSGLRIIACSRALPAKRVSNEDLGRQVDTSDEWIRTRTGISNRYYCEEESCASLAVEASRNVIDKAGIDPMEIGAVLVATTTADYAFPSTACIIQKECRLPEDIVAFDINAACSGFLMGMAVARGLFAAMNKKYVLLIGAEKLSRILDPEDRSTCVLFGDGAGAILLEKVSGRMIQRTWARGNIGALNCPGVGQHPAVLSMNGNEVFRFAVTALTQAVTEVLGEAKLSIEDIDLVVCHQANERIIRYVQRHFPGNEDRFFLNINEYGNTSAASIPIALSECEDKGILKKCRRILLVGFGAGLSWSGLLMEEQ